MISSHRPLCVLAYEISGRVNKNVKRWEFSNHQGEAVTLIGQYTDYILVQCLEVPPDKIHLIKPIENKTKNEDFSHAR